MKVLDSATRAYWLDGDAISEGSLDEVLGAAYTMLARNDEIAPPFEDWDEEESEADGEHVYSYFARTDAGNEVRIAFHRKDMKACVMLSSPEEECYIGDDLLCTITSAERKFSVEEWL